MLPTPKNTTESMLRALAEAVVGGTYQYSTANTNVEKYLQAIVGRFYNDYYDLPTPKTNIEKYLKSIAENFNPSGGGEKPYKNIQLWKNDGVTNGYVTDSGTMSGIMDSTQKEGTMWMIPVNNGDIITFKVNVTVIGTGSQGLWMAYTMYDEFGRFYGSRTVLNSGYPTIDGKAHGEMIITIPKGIHYVTLSCRRYNDYVASAINYTNKY